MVAGGGKGQPAAVYFIGTQRQPDRVLAVGAGYWEEIDKEDDGCYGRTVAKLYSTGDDQEMTGQEGRGRERGGKGGGRVPEYCTVQ